MPDLTSVAGRARKLGHQLGTRVRYALDPDPVVAIWWTGRPNFGDLLTASLIDRMTGCEPFHARDVRGWHSGAVVSAIGSILQAVRGSEIVVWGSGFLRESSAFAQIPAEIRAVRGPLTRAQVLKQGVACPEVYGDPALLYPRFFRPHVRKRFRLGLVPHYWDKPDPNVARLRANEDTLLIDVQRDPDSVIRDMLACEAIASSSLHGVILALAYGIPAAWVEFSDKVEGKGFKFRDFFMSIQAPVRLPFRVDSDTEWQELVDHAELFPVELDVRLLLESCPFAVR
jgi:pyruvyltransferase